MKAYLKALALVLALLVAVVLALAGLAVVFENYPELTAFTIAAGTLFGLTFLLKEYFEE